MAVVVVVVERVSDGSRVEGSLGNENEDATGLAAPWGHHTRYTPWVAG